MGQPEWMPDADAAQSSRNAEILDAWVVRRSWVEDVVEIGGGEVEVGGGI